MLKPNKHSIGISAYGTASPLGMQGDTIRGSYHLPGHHLLLKEFSVTKEWCAPIHAEVAEALGQLTSEKAAYQGLDRSVLLGMLAARKALEGFSIAGKRVGVNMGSSRGATGLLEQAHAQFTAEGAAKVPTRTSPATTLGNIASWIGQDLKLQGIHLEHSITCSTALHAVLNGIAWLQSGMADAFLVGGAEAPLTDFTVAQMKALRLYAPNTMNDFPCRGVDYDNASNTLVLGEAAGAFFMEMDPKNPLAWISGWGFASETITTNTSIDAQGIGFQQSMKLALEKAELDASEIDAVVMHAPGTHKGDTAEFEAIKTVFKGHLPLMTGNKWKIGHCFGASGALSMEMAILMLERGTFIKTPFCQGDYPQKIQRVMVNAMGFGGNAVSLVLCGR